MDPQAQDSEETKKKKSIVNLFKSSSSSSTKKVKGDQVVPKSVPETQVLSGSSENLDKKNENLSSLTGADGAVGDEHGDEEKINQPPPNTAPQDDGNNTALLKSLKGKWFGGKSGESKKSKADKVTKNLTTPPDDQGPIKSKKTDEEEAFVAAVKAKNLTDPTQGQAEAESNEDNRWQEVGQSFGKTGEQAKEWFQQISNEEKEKEKNLKMVPAAPAKKSDKEKSSKFTLGSKSKSDKQPPSGGGAPNLPSELETKVILTEIERHPLLFDSTLEEFKDPIKRAEAWNEIGGKIGKSGTEAKGIYAEYLLMDGETFQLPHKSPSLILRAEEKKHFLEVVKKFPCLYNPDDTNYNNQTVVWDAWKSVANKIQRTDMEAKRIYTFLEQLGETAVLVEGDVQIDMTEEEKALFLDELRKHRYLLDNSYKDAEITAEKRAQGWTAVAMAIKRSEEETRRLYRKLTFKYVDFGRKVMEYLLAPSDQERAELLAGIKKYDFLIDPRRKEYQDMDQFLPAWLEIGDNIKACCHEEAQNLFIKLTFKLIERATQILPMMSAEDPAAPKAVVEQTQKILVTFQDEDYQILIPDFVKGTGHEDTFKRAAWEPIGKKIEKSAEKTEEMFVEYLIKSFKLGAPHLQFWSVPLVSNIVVAGVAFRKVLRAIRKRKILTNVNAEGHSDKEKRDKSWEEVGKEVGISAQEAETTYMDCLFELTKTVKGGELKNVKKDDPRWEQVTEIIGLLGADEAVKREFKQEPFCVALTKYVGTETEILATIKEFQLAHLSESTSKKGIFGTKLSTTQSEEKQTDPASTTAETQASKQAKTPKSKAGAEFETKMKVLLQNRKAHVDELNGEKQKMEKIVTQLTTQKGYTTDLASLVTLGGLVNQVVTLGPSDIELALDGLLRSGAAAIKKTKWGKALKKIRTGIKFAASVKDDVVSVVEVVAPEAAGTVDMIGTVIQDVDAVLDVVDELVESFQDNFMDDEELQSFLNELDDVIQKSPSLLKHAGIIFVGQGQGQQPALQIEEEVGVKKELGFEPCAMAQDILRPVQTTPFNTQGILELLGDPVGLAKALQIMIDQLEADCEGRQKQLNWLFYLQATE